MKPESAPGAIDRSKTVETINELAHLSSSVGHHVINGFSAIVSNAEILRLRLGKSDSPEQLAVLAAAIIRASVDAASVARRLIDVTRPMTAIGDAAVDVDRLLTEYVEAKSAREFPGVRWVREGGGVPAIRGDAGQLRSMLDHFSTNALEAMRSKAAMIRFSTSLDDRGWVVIEIRDDGLGMTPEILEHAVEPFFSTKGRIGVGLSLANGIWRRHRGTLSVISRPNEGTTIRLCVEPIRATR